MKLLIKVRRDALRFWKEKIIFVLWAKSCRGHYISMLEYPLRYEFFFDSFFRCQKKDFQRKLYHDYWWYKKVDYYKKYKKEQSK